MVESAPACGTPRGGRGGRHRRYPARTVPSSMPITPRANEAKWVVVEEMSQEQQVTPDQDSLAVIIVAHLRGQRIAKLQRSVRQSTSQLRLAPDRDGSRPLAVVV